MNEEEMKQTLLKHCKECHLREYASCVECEEKFAKATNKALNYIDKLQKELKDSINARFELQRRIDKIKEALGDKNIPDDMILTYIETLVSENARLEDIEDRKVQIEYNNVFNKGVKSVEDRIRDKIKELEKTTAEELRYDFLMNRDEVKRAVVKVLEELLN